MTPAGHLQFRSEVHPKEQLLEDLEKQRKEAGVEVTNARIERIERSGGVLLLHHGDKKTITKARRVIIGIGRSGNHRKLGVPGEDLDKVFNRLYDPKEFAGQQVLVVGGGDSALETTIALVTSGAHVTLSYRKKEFARPKSENIAKIDMLVRDATADVQIENPTSERINTAMTSGMRRDKKTGSLKLALGTEINRIEPDRVVLTNGTEQPLPNDVVFTMLGREAPLEFFRRSKIPIAGESTTRGWILVSLFLAFCVFLYAWKSGGFAESWLNPWPENIPQLVKSLGAWFQ